MTMHNAARIEKEWQFAAEELDATRAWLAQQPADPAERRFAPRSTVELQDTYYDSDDWMIFRAGFALRLRQTREQAGAESHELTLKSLTPARSGFARRQEINEAVGGGDIHRALSQSQGFGERLRELIGERPLVPLFHAHTRRERQWLLEAGTELPLAEVDLDQCSIQSPDGRTRQLVRIEVECLNAEPAVLQPLIEQMRQTAGLLPAAQSKFRTGLDVAGLADKLPLALPKRTVSAGQPFVESQMAVLGGYFETVLEREPAARAGSPEAVHDMRVAARHLEILLKAFGTPGPLWAVRSRNIIRKLVKALGEVRDCDVQIAHLATRVALQDGGPLALDPIRQRVEAERAAERAGLLKLLDSGDLREWHLLWRRELAAAPVTTPGAPATALVARELIRGQARKLRKRAERIHDGSPPDEYHEVRIRAKRLRYVLEPFAVLYGDAARDFLGALGRLQDVLGRYHDAVMRASRFSRMAAEENPDAAASFTLGRLVESEQPALVRCQARYPKAWRRVRRRRWRALEAAMKELAGQN